MGERRTGTVRIGTSGYQYRHWKGIFYPESLPQREWFEYFARQFDTVEINNTFYRLPEPEVFESWRDRSPAGFLYALKFSRFATHRRKLNEPAEPIERFADRARRLGAHLGPILVQLPPRWRRNLERLEAFLALVPKRWRWAVEFRDPSWLGGETFELLHRHGAALCVHDMIANHPRELTAGWTYLRYHGPGPGGDYPDAVLREEARRIAEWRGMGVDVYAYFNNDWHGYALANARDLSRHVGELEAMAVRR